MSYFDKPANAVAKCREFLRVLAAHDGPDGPEKMSAVVCDDILDPDLRLPDDDTPVEVEPKAMTTKQLADLIEAARYGGAEFLNMAIDACQSVIARNRGDLPEPVDPTAT